MKITTFLVAVVVFGGLMSRASLQTRFAPGWLPQVVWRSQAEKS